MDKSKCECGIVQRFILGDTVTSRLKLYLYSIDHNKIAINNQLITNEIFT